MSIKKYTPLIYIPITWLVSWITIWYLKIYDFDVLLISGIINTISSVLLAILTLVYVNQNQIMLDEMATARKSDLMPHMKSSIVHLSKKIMIVLLKNIGKGPAINLDISYGFQKSQRKWIHPLISPEESYKFLYHSPKINELFIIEGMCQDVFGQNHIIKETINLKDINKSSSENVILPETSIVSSLNEIKNEVERIYHEFNDYSHTHKTQHVPSYMKINDIEISQPPLQRVIMHLGGIDFKGVSLDHSMNDILKGLTKEDIAEINCNDENGIIFSGIVIIKDIVLEEKTINEKKTFSFDIKLGHPNL